MRAKLILLLCICLPAFFFSCDDTQEPDVVAVMGVSLNKDALTLFVGESKTLQAVITPDDATNKKVNWTSEDESIATVSAEGDVTALKEGTTTVIAVTEEGAKTATCVVSVKSQGSFKGSRTVLAYIAADNTLSQFARQDLEEMKAGMAKVKDNDVHFLVYIDDGSSPRLLELRNEGGKVVEEVVAAYSSRNSVGVAETKEVFETVFSNPRYQADSYGLVYWSHGDGWLPYPLRASSRWVGQDKSDRMNISEFAEILQVAPHFDFIMFDACFMQSVEVAYELRDYTDYLIASPTEIPGPGASYDEVVPAMFSTEDVAIHIARAYYEPYAAIYDNGKGISNANWTGGTSVCALRTDLLPNLAMLTKQILPEKINSIQLRASVFNYDKRSGSGGYQDGHVGYYDLDAMMRMIAADDDYTLWKQAFDATIVYWNTTSMNYSAFAGMFSMAGTNGVSCYIPTTADNLTDKAYRLTEWYTAVGLDKIHW